MIKIEDLFPGAWVSYQGRPWQVYGMCGPLKVQDGNEPFDGKSTVFLRDGNTLTPALESGINALCLTDKILLLNGFMHCMVDSYPAFECTDETYRKYRIGFGRIPRIMTEGGPCRYKGNLVSQCWDTLYYRCHTVHALQRFLIACGCRDLAMDFKIETKAENDGQE